MGEFFNTSSAISVQDLRLVLDDDEDANIPLKRVQINMGIDTPCICSCEPIIGDDCWNNKFCVPYLAEFMAKSRAGRIVMRIGERNEIGGNESTLFVGRPISSSLQVSTSPVGSAVGVPIMLQHLAQNELSSIAIGQRSYYEIVTDIHPFRVDPNGNGVTPDLMLSNDNLRQGKIAVYIKDLCAALADWYMKDELDVSVADAILAVPCKIRQEVLNIFAAKGGKAVDSVQGAFTQAVATTLAGITASKGTLLSLLSTLGSFAMLSLVPTTYKFVLTPKLDVSKWTLATGTAINRGWITGVSSSTTVKRYPIHAVSLNKRLGNKYIPSSTAESKKTGLTSWGTLYRYPENAKGEGTLLVDPPPILANLIDCTSNTSYVGEPPKTVDKGGEGSDKNSAGAEATRLAENAAIDLGKAAARLMWSKLAYSHRAVQLQLLPNWVFSRRFDRDVHADYETGVPWSLIGKNVFFQMPYGCHETEKWRDIPYIGYVKGMSLSVSVDGPVLGVSADVTNIRTAREDNQFAFPSESNPLYTDVDADPV